jgi:Ca2+-binding RTX toxin-like protein
MRRHKHKLHPRRSLVGTAVTLGVLVLAASLPAAAQARTSCAFSGAPLNVMTVSVSGESFAVIIRRGEEITVAELGDAPQPCAGAIPTVSNTDTINVLLSGDAAIADVSLAGGPLAPGATAETVGAPEIEIQASGPEGGVLGVVGTRGDDRFRWGAGGANPGLNLNPAAGDEDIDVTVLGGEFGAFLNVDGGAGNDTISGDPTAGHGNVYASGGPGNDVLTAPPGNVTASFDGGAGNDVITGSAGDDTLRGDAGHDRILGGGGADDITGGTGRDRINAGAGRDLIKVHDTARDTVSCGTGRDRVNTDRRDRVSGCERISRR